MKKFYVLITCLMFIGASLTADAQNLKKLVKPKKKEAVEEKKPVVEKKKPAKYKIPNGKYESVNTYNNSNIMINVFEFNSKTKIVKVLEEKGVSEYAFTCDSEGMSFYYLDGNRKPSQDVAQRWTYVAANKNFKMTGAETIILREKKIHKLFAPNGIYEVFMVDANYVGGIYNFNKGARKVKVMGDKDEVTYAVATKGKQIILYYLDGKKRPTKDVFETWNFDENNGVFYIQSNEMGKKILKEKAKTKK